MDILPFISFAIITSFTPGPNNIMSMTIAGQRGFFRALRYCIGVGIGFFALLLLAALFATALEQSIGSIELAMKIVGALYMLYLAFIILRDKPHEEKEGGKRRTLRPDSILTGTVLQFVNPKGIFYSIAAMSTYVLPHYKGLFEISLFAAALAVVGFVSTVLWGLCGAVFERIFKEHKKVLNIVLALLLVYCAVSLFL